MSTVEDRCQKIAEQLAWFAKQCQGTASHNNQVLQNRIKKELVGMYYEGLTDCRRTHDS